MAIKLQTTFSSHQQQQSAFIQFYYCYYINFHPCYTICVCMCVSYFDAQKNNIRIIVGGCCVTDPELYKSMFFPVFHIEMKNLTFE